LVSIATECHQGLEKFTSHLFSKRFCASLLKMQRKINFGLNVKHTVDETAWSVAVLNFIKILFYFIKI